MPLVLEAYLDQQKRWPAAGRHILAQFDAHRIVVYQAYRPSIAAWAVAHQRFGGPEFSFDRMSWIKPNFLWMMFRSGWASKPDQESVLAVRLRREFFDDLLLAAVTSARDDGQFETHEAWRQVLARSEVRLQWDPDHHPSGAKLERRALQLGVRGDLLRRFAHEASVEIEDIAVLVRAQLAMSWQAGCQSCKRHAKASTFHKTPRRR